MSPQLEAPVVTCCARESWPLLLMVWKVSGKTSVRLECLAAVEPEWAQSCGTSLQEAAALGRWFSKTHPHLARDQHTESPGLSFPSPTGLLQSKFKNILLTLGERKTSDIFNKQEMMRHNSAGPKGLKFGFTVRPSPPPGLASAVLLALNIKRLPRFLHIHSSPWSS